VRTGAGLGGIGTCCSQSQSLKFRKSSHPPRLPISQRRWERRTRELVEEPVRGRAEALLVLLRSAAHFVDFSGWSWGGREGWLEG
jgi:hypothetical protein